MPALVVLALRDRAGFGFIGDRLMSELTYGNHVDSCLCARLETLRLDSVFACQDGPIADMVESRWRSGFVSRNDVVPTFAEHYARQPTKILHSQVIVVAGPLVSLRKDPARLTTFGLCLDRDATGDLFSRLDAMKEEGLILEDMNV